MSSNVGDPTWMTVIHHECFTSPTAKCRHQVLCVDSHDDQGSQNIADCFIDFVTHPPKLTPSRLFKIHHQSHVESAGMHASHEQLHSQCHGLSHND